MKKVLGILLAAIMALTSFSAIAFADEKETLEFYHGYFHEESTWAPAKIMRDIFQEFATRHQDGPVEFKQIPVENGADLMKNMIAGGKFPNVIDLAGQGVPFSALAQNLVLDLKPYIDQEGIQNKVGINYTQNDVDGHIYSVHDQLLTLGLWYNAKIFADAKAALPADWKTWEDFKTSMETIRAYGKDKGLYAYGSGSLRLFNTMLAQTQAGVDMINAEMTPEILASEEFKNAFLEVASYEQANGSGLAGLTNDFAADFNAEKSAMFINGVWAAGGFSENDNIQPAVYPCNVALSSAGGGITIASDLSENQKALALEFLKYMTSDEVQAKIFLEVGANPCNKDLDIEALANESNDKIAKLLAKACSLCNNAETIVVTLTSWDGEVTKAIENVLLECSVSGVDINQKYDELVKEITALIL